MRAHAYQDILMNVALHYMRAPTHKTWFLYEYKNSHLTILEGRRYSIKFSYDIGNKWDLKIPVSPAPLPGIHVQCTQPGNKDLREG